MKSNRFLLFGFTVCMLAFGALFLYYRQFPHPSVSSEKSAPQRLQHSVKHLALIMDGNRRWAKKRGLKPWEGHQAGTEPVKRAVEFCIEQGIPYLSLYTFSTENLTKRSPEELKNLFSIIKQGLSTEEFEKLFSHGVSIKFIGDRSLFPPDLIKQIEQTEQKTKGGKNLQVQILFCYGGTLELTAACKAIAQEVADGKLAPQAITPEVIEQHLWTAGTPPPDLVMRTGGMMRLSNFFPWQSAYSELLFVDKFWPDITKKDLAQAIQTYEERKRNFGA